MCIRDRVLGSRRGETDGAPSHRIWRDIDVERARGDVEADPVTVLDERDGSAVDRLGSHVPDTQARRAPGESTVGQQQHVLAETRALDGTGDRQHLAHPGPSLCLLYTSD